jgi:regulator of RNase E activity RraA
MTEWANDSALFELVRNELSVAVIGDILDAHNYIHQFLPPNIRPLQPEIMLVGRAMPVLEADVYDNKKPFGLMFHALDDLKPGEIYLATGGTPNYSLWGELMSTAAIARGAVGAILNGFMRDTKAVLKMNFPVFSMGSFAQDQRVRGRVIDYRCEVEIKRVRIRPGDILIGDIDGVVVVPAEIEKLIFAEALEKARTEKIIRVELEQGALATAVFEKYQIM